MVARNICIVLVRLFSIYLAMLAVQGLVHAYSFVAADIPAFRAENAFQIAIFVASVFVPLIASFLVWWLAPLIARNTYDTTESESVIGVDELFNVGVALIGLYAFVFGLIKLSNIEGSLALDALLGEGFDRADRLRRLTMRLPYLIELFLGAILIVGRRRISSLIMKARYIGRNAS